MRESPANCAGTAHNAQRCYPGRSRCNLNLIARYFGRAYAYACKVGRGLIKRLRAALHRHADELARFASPGLRVPARPGRIVEDRAGCSGAAPRDLNLLTTVYQNSVMTKQLTHGTFLLGTSLNPPKLNSPELPKFDANFTKRCVRASRIDA